jgi:hypothetical protein
MFGISLQCFVRLCLSILLIHTIVPKAEFLRTETSGSYGSENVHYGGYKCSGENLILKIKAVW